VFLICACNHHHMAQPTWDIVNMESEQFSKLSVVWGGAVSPEFVKTEIVVDSNKEVSMNMKYYADAKVQNECTGKATLTEQEYEKIVSLVSSTDLFHYRPPIDCQPLYGSQGVTVAYTRSDSSSSSFDSVCELDKKIDDLLYTVDAAAHNNITDCSWQLLMQEEGTETSGQTS